MTMMRETLPVSCISYVEDDLGEALVDELAGARVGDAVAREDLLPLLLREEGR